MDARAERSEEMVPLQEESAYDGAGRTSSPSHNVCKFVCGLFVITLLVTALFGGGLFTGYGAICDRHRTCKCTGGANSVTAKWGGEVNGTGSGTAVPVSKWLDDEMKAGNIRENLRFGTAT